MALESVTHITDLVAANPVTGDPVSQGDDHLKNIKTALLNDFGNISGAVTADQADLNRTDISTEGTAQASKVLTADSSGYTTGAEFISPKVQTGVNDTNGNELLKVTATGSAVNELTIENAATGNNPTITASGDDTDIGIALTAKGTGGIDLNPGTDGVTIGTGAGVVGVLDEDDMVSDSDTHLATQQSIKAYVDTTVPPIETARDIGGDTISSGGGDVFTNAHGLSGQPDIVQVYAKCNSVAGDGTYSQNDIIMLGTSNQNSNGAIGGISVWADATNIVIAVITNASPLIFTEKDASGSLVADETKWDLYANAIYFGA